MLTRIEIDGFKTFENFGLDLEPLTAVVGPNASGKSSLFDALRFLSLLAQFDIRTAMQGLRGEPEELFRRTAAGDADDMSFALEVLLSRKGVDAFGTSYETPAQRLRYELKLGLSRNTEGTPRGIFVRGEHCYPIAKQQDRSSYLRGVKLSYIARVAPLIRLSETGDAIEIRQDGRQKHGRDLTSLIPSVRKLEIRNDPNQKQYSFSLEFAGDLVFSSRVISDGTLRLLALLTVLDDPRRRGTLCFEEPENGVHEGRVPMLVEYLRSAADVSIDAATPSFQIILNTHSPKVMAALHDREIVAADTVVSVDPHTRLRSSKTRMRTGVQPTLGPGDASFQIRG